MTTRTRSQARADTRYAFLTSKERDNETGLDYFNARYHSSPQGRFISADPLITSGKVVVPQSWNRYTYCLNNPLAFIDPSGLEWRRHDETGQIRWYGEDDDRAGTTEYTQEYYETSDGQWVHLNLAGPTRTAADADFDRRGWDFVDAASVPSIYNGANMPSVQAAAGVNNLELALPDYYQLEINIAIPNKFTLTAVGVSLTGTLDRNGNIYGGIGPSVGKSTPGVSGAATANYVIDGMTRTVRNEDQLASFLSGHSITAGAGFGTGGHGTWVQGNGFALGTGFYTPQIGAAYKLLVAIGKPFSRGRLDATPYQLVRRNLGGKRNPNSVLSNRVSFCINCVCAVS